MCTILCKETNLSQLKKMEKYNQQIQFKTDIQLTSDSIHCSTQHVLQKCRAIYRGKRTE